METPREGASQMPAAPPQTPAQPVQLAQQSQQAAPPQWQANSLSSAERRQPPQWQANPLAGKALQQAEEPAQWQQHADGGVQWQSNPVSSSEEGDSDQDFLAWQMQQTPQRQDKEAPMPSLELQSPGWEAGRGSGESAQQQQQRSPLGPALQELPTPRPSVQQEECFFWLLEELAVGSGDQWEQVQEALELGCAEDERYRAVLPAQR